MVKVFTQRELIEHGFLPTAQRARMSVPFNPVSHCSAGTYARLPEHIKQGFLAYPDKNGIHHRGV